VFFAWLGGMLLAYLALVEAAKRFFYARLDPRGKDSALDMPFTNRALPTRSIDTSLTLDS
jgi:hypothetical protein